MNFEVGVSDQLPPNPETTTPQKPVKAYVKLINNNEPAFENFADKELTYDEMILQLKESTILICPEEYDILEANLKVKNEQTVSRAIEDIVMASRYYAIKSDDFNGVLEPDMITVKSKPNPEYDSYFFDDEEKDWTNFVWYPNKASIGNFTIEGTENEPEIKFNPTIETTRPHLHKILEDTQPEEVYREVTEDDESSTFLVNLRNFVRLLGLVNMVNVPK